MNRKGHLKKDSGKTRRENPPRYLILTDGEKTEKYYFEGLKDDLSKDRIKIKVIPKKAKTIQKLVDIAHKECRDEDYALVAIVIDRDEIKDFDQKVYKTNSLKIYKQDVMVGWSNPCIETWLSAYFGPLISGNTSQECIEKFKRLFKQKTGQEYTKTNKDLYKLLIKWGKEKEARKRAEETMKRHKEVGHLKPSEQIPGTTVHEVLKAIRGED